MEKQEEPDKKHYQVQENLKHLQILTKKQVCALVGFTPQYILILEKKGEFPQRIQIGENSVGWYLVEIEEWIKSRPRGPVSPPRYKTTVR